MRRKDYILLIFLLSGVFGRHKFCLLRIAERQDTKISPEGFISLSMREKKNSSRCAKLLGVCASCPLITSPSFVQLMAIIKRKPQEQ